MMNKIKKWFKSVFNSTKERKPEQRYISELNFITGDMIAFSGKGTISNIIKKWTNSDISHVACVVVEDGGIYIYESTTLVDLPDIETGKIIKGMQKHLLSNRLKNYKGQLYFYPQTLKPSPKAKEAMVAWIKDIHKQEVPYSQIEAIFAGIDPIMLHEIGLFTNHADFAYIFCSEAVAKVQKIKYIIDYPTHAIAHCNPSEITPANLCKSNIFYRGYEIVEERI